VAVEPFSLCASKVRHFEEPQNSPSLLLFVHFLCTCILHWHWHFAFGPSSARQSFLSLALSALLAACNLNSVFYLFPFFYLARDGLIQSLARRTRRRTGRIDLLQVATYSKPSHLHSIPTPSFASICLKFLKVWQCLVLCRCVTWHCHFFNHDLAD
jgi:hypothetical protein